MPAILVAIYTFMKGAVTYFWPILLMAIFEFFKWLPKRMVTAGVATMAGVGVGAGVFATLKTIAKLPPWILQKYDVTVIGDWFNLASIFVDVSFLMNLAIFDITAMASIATSIFTFKQVQKFITAKA